MTKAALALVLLVMAASMAHADFTRKMVARWTFNSPVAEKAMIDDVSGVKLIKAGTGKDQTLSFRDGKAILGGGTLLIAADLNSGNEKFAGLKEQITIWAKIKFTTNPKGCFPLGLLSGKIPADWGQQVMSLSMTDKSEPRLFATNPAGKHFGCGLKDVIDEKSGFCTVALTYDKAKTLVTLTVNGKTVSGKDKNGEALDAFQCLGVGRLKVHAAAQMEIDELRVYDAVITPEWQGEIETVENQTPAKTDGK